MGRPRKGRIELPTGVERKVSRGKVYWYYTPHRGTDREGERIPIAGSLEAPPGAPEFTRFWIELEAAMRRGPAANFEFFAARLVYSSRARAKEKDIPHTIATADVMCMLVEQDARCSLSGIPFDLKAQTEGDLFDRPFAPSLDRKNNSRGYEPDNVRLVCRIVNFGMGKWGFEAFRRAAIGVVKVSRGCFLSTIERR